MSKKRATVTTYRVNPYPPYNRIIVYPSNDGEGSDDESDEQKTFRSHTESLVYAARVQLFGKAVRSHDCPTLRLCLDLPQHYDKEWMIGAGSTALHWAVDSKYIDVLEILFEYKVQASKLDLYGRSALCLAQFGSGNEPAVTLMVMKYAITREAETKGEDRISDDDYIRIATCVMHDYFHHFRTLAYETFLATGYTLICERRSSTTDEE